ncbi:hypothetical protein [Actinoplanes palleronii]|uniref:Uncharacterized protein n=1 Tax=Actinoplanes palleronii TaxID=113570 RepID=A0ABQ4B9X7_9ACTN|nr:hypothetical protein [Actinoplanes palleronii]GIE67395.1 hypothetical protein Apa02nite_035030 [Actinoplanes palleronii]
MATIETLAERVVRKTAPDQVGELRIVAQGFFGSDHVRHRVVNSVLVGGGGAAPVGVDAVSGTLIVQTALVLLQAVATDTASDLIRDQAGNGLSWWRRRRAARALHRAGKTVTATTEMPAVSAKDALLLAEIGRGIVERSGGSKETADLFAIVFAAEVCPQAREIDER